MTTGAGVTGVGAGLVVFDPAAQIGVVAPIDIRAAIAASVILFNRKVFIILFSIGGMYAIGKQNSDRNKLWILSFSTGIIFRGVFLFVVLVGSLIQAGMARRKFCSPDGVKRNPGILFPPGSPDSGSLGLRIRAT